MFSCVHIVFFNLYFNILTLLVWHREGHYTLHISRNSEGVLGDIFGDQALSVVAVSAAASSVCFVVTFCDI